MDDSGHGCKLDYSSFSPRGLYHSMPCGLFFAFARTAERDIVSDVCNLSFLSNFLIHYENIISNVVVKYAV